jgi:hypothetical protein
MTVATMTTYKVTMPRKVSSVIARKAKVDKTSMSKAILNLIEEAIERKEDAYFGEIALKNKAETTRFYTHEEAWK